MPANTPIYGFTYPCPGDLITAGAFTTLANQIDAKLLDLSDDLDIGLNRHSTFLYALPPQLVPTGVDTALTALTYVIPMAGVWIVKANAFTADNPATITVERIRVLQNAVYRFGFTQNTEGNVPKQCDAQGPIVAAVGDIISVNFLHTASVAINVGGHFAAKMLVKSA